MSDQPHGKVIRVSVKGYSEVEICNHALQRMEQRGITEQEIIAAIRRPTLAGLPTEPGRIRVRKNRSNSEAVDVVYVESRPTRILVVTVIVIRGRTRRRRT